MPTCTSATARPVRAASCCSTAVDAELCRGCGLCAKKCPAEAIMGAPKSPHYIVPDKCIGCGTCEDVCRFEAVKTE